MATGTFSDAQISAVGGWTGLFDLTTASGQRIMISDFSCLMTYITGTGFTLATTCQAGLNPYMIWVDGSPAVNPVVASGVVAVTGLAEGTHLVRIVSQDGYVGYANTPMTGAVLTVTGAAPAISAGSDIGPYHNFTDPTYPGGAIFQVANSASYTNATAPLPATVVSRALLSLNGSAAVRANCTDLWVYTADSHCAYAIDGGAFTTVALDNTGDAFRRPRKVATGLSGTHIYTVIPGFATATPVYRGPIGIMVGGGTGFVGTYKPQTIVQYGDSITAGEDATYSSDLDFFQYAHAYGMLAMGVGVPGYTTAQILSYLPTWLAALNAPPTGRNDSTSDSTVPGNYTACITAALAAGARTVIARGVTPWVWALNPTLAAAVAAMNNPNVIYVETDTWAPIETGGAGDGNPISEVTGTHPTTYGYQEMTAFEIPAYASILGNPVVASSSTSVDPGIAYVLSPASGGPTNYAINGTTLVGTATIPLATTVLSTAPHYGVGGTGSTGTVVQPPANTVLSTQTFGPGSTIAGTVIQPTTGQVELSVPFGPGGGLTGTYSAGGGSGLTLGTVMSTPRNVAGLADGQVTVADIFWGIYAAAAGQAEVSGTSFTLKTPAGTTIRPFALDSATVPTERT